MKKILVLLLALAPLVQAVPIAPDKVIVLYNSSISDSKKLARYYAKARNIPQVNLIGLELSSEDAITRSEYNLTLRNPLRQILITEGLWTMGQDTQGTKLPIKNQISTLVCMRGVPFKIKRDTAAATPSKKLPSQLAAATEASVDSELALSGVHGAPSAGPINNPYFKKNTGITSAKIPFLLLVGRIDGPSYSTCRQMIDDAIATEKQGLWGMCYLDKSLKGGAFAIGDQWLDKIAQFNDPIGIPTVVDANKQTFTTNYPMNEAALYFGWYTTQRNGPLLNPSFQFRRGAIAVHLHSFSAAHLRNPDLQWAGPILAKGAAATLGNVYEPYLHLTHHFDIFHARLLEGHSLVEAAYMALPYLSWQNVVLGDPLYRPFIHLNGGGQVAKEDRHFRAIRVANQRWGSTPEDMVKNLRNSAAENGNAYFYEYLGLWFTARKQTAVAAAFFQTASKKHIQASDRLRQWIYTADLQRGSGNKAQAIETLKQARQLFAKIPEVKSVVALLNILDPPAPPLAEKVKKNKK